MSSRQSADAQGLPYGVNEINWVWMLYLEDWTIYNTFRISANSSSQEIKQMHWYKVQMLCLCMFTTLILRNIQITHTV